MNSVRFRFHFILQLTPPMPSTNSICCLAPVLLTNTN